MPSIRHGIIALLSAVAFTTATHAQSQPPVPAAMSKLQAATSLAPMLERVLPGVVSVLIEGERELPQTLEDSGLVSGPPVKEPFRSGGSGVIVDAEKGLILTNHHVIVDASRINVLLSDGRLTEAKLLGSDIATDVAVLQIPLKGLTVIPYGDSDALRIGDFIAAVGNPYGLEGSASQGIVSALMRSDIGYGIFEDFIQIDAAVNPGNSGGALVDIEGRLIGINTATGSARMRAQGISFAIPINMARSIAGEIIATGRFRRGSIGVLTEDLTFATAQKMGLNITRGAAVKSVLPGTPAAEAGIKPGDVIVSIAGKAVHSHTDYKARVSTTPIGKALPFVFVSGPSRKEVTLTVAQINYTPEPQLAPLSLPSLKGLTLGTILPGFKAFGVIQGARVLSVGSGPMANSGLKPDDVITKIDMAAVRTPQDLFDTASTKMGRFRLEVDRDGRKLWVWAGS